MPRKLPSIRRAVTSAMAVSLLAIPSVALRNAGPGHAASGASAMAAGGDVIDDGTHRVIRSEVAWGFLEDRARQAVAELHGVPNDARLLIWARPEITAAVFGQLLAIAEMPPEDRSPEESWALMMFAQRVWGHEREIAQHALAEYDRWASDPCWYVPPGGMPYDRSGACSPIGVLYSSPKPPSVAEFTAYGTVLANDFIADDPRIGAAIDEANRSFGHLGLLAVGPLAGVLAASGLLATGTATAFYTSVAVFAGVNDFVLTATAGTVVASKSSLAAAGAASGAFVVTVAVTAAIIAYFEGEAVFEATQVRPLLAERVEDAEGLPEIEDILDTDEGAARLFVPFFRATLDGGTQPHALPRPEVGWAPEPAGDRYRVEDLDAGGSLESPTFPTIAWDGTQQVTYEDADGWLVTRRAGGRAFRSLSLPFVDGTDGGSRLRARLVTHPDGYSVAPDALDPSSPGGCGDGNPRCSEGMSFSAVGPAHERRRITKLPNLAPVIEQAGATRVTGLEGELIRFWASATDPEGAAVEYRWKIERPRCHLCPVGSSTIYDTYVGREIDHVFTDDGSFDVEVTATDPTGLESSLAFTVLVLNAAPVLSVAPGPAPGGGLTGAIEGEWHDPGIGDGHSVHIDWGDGTTEAFEHPKPVGFPRVREHPDGTRTFRAGRTYAGEGTWTVTVTVTDDEGASAVASTTLTTRAPDPPPPGSTAPEAPTSVIAWPVEGAGPEMGFVPPAYGGAPILRYEFTEAGMNYFVDGWIRREHPWPLTLLGSGHASVPSHLDYPLPDPSKVKIRAVNANGPGPWSDVSTPVPDGDAMKPSFEVVGPTEAPDTGPVHLTVGDIGLAPGRSVDHIGWTIGAAGTLRSIGPTATIRVGPVGTVPVEVTVTDDAGWSTTRHHVVEIVNVAPVLELPDRVEADPTGRVELAFAGFDPGEVPSGSPFQHRWVDVWVDWGDGRRSAGNGWTREHLFDHVYAVPGSYVVEVATADEHGARVIGSVVVVVHGPPGEPLGVRPDGTGGVRWEPPSGGDADRYEVTWWETDEDGLSTGPPVHRDETAAAQMTWSGAAPMRRYRVDVAACSVYGCSTVVPGTHVDTQPKQVAVRGRVVGPDGEPVVGAEVRAIGEGAAEDDPRAVGRTGTDGTFVLDVLTPVGVRLLALPGPDDADLDPTWLGGGDRDDALLLELLDGTDTSLDDLVMAPSAAPVPTTGLPTSTTSTTEPTAVTTTVPGTTTAGATTSVPGDTTSPATGSSTVPSSAMTPSSSTPATTGVDRVGTAGAGRPGRTAGVDDSRSVRMTDGATAVRARPAYTG